MSFDVSSLDAFVKEEQEEGVEVALLHPKTGDEVGIIVRVAGPDSQRQVQARRTQVNARLRRRSSAPMTAEELEAENVRVLARSTISWHFGEGVTIDGEVPNCTVDEMEKFYRRFPFWREQVDQAAGNRAGF